MQAEHLAQCRAFYDRAALIALPPEMRERHAGHLQAVLPTRSLGLLVTIDYPQAEMAGPPFAVPDEEVRGYYAGGWRIEELERGDVLGVNWKFLERGVSWLNEAVYLLERAETEPRGARPFSAELSTSTARVLRTSWPSRLERAPDQPVPAPGCRRSLNGISMVNARQS